MYINNKKLKLLIVSISLLVSSVNVYAENTDKKQNKQPTGKVDKTKKIPDTYPKPGDSVSGKFVSTFEPEPFVGLKYTFISKAVGGEYILPDREETTEVISMNNGYATLLLSGSHRDYREKVIKVSDIRSSGVIYVQFKYDGLSDVNVPFAKFKNATKVSVSNKTNELSLWLVKGIGVVKLVEYDKATKGKIITELKDFRSKKNIFPDKIPNKMY